MDIQKLNKFIWEKDGDLSTTHWELFYILKGLQEQGYTEELGGRIQTLISHMENIQGDLSAIGQYLDMGESTIIPWETYTLQYTEEIREQHNKK